MSEEGREGRQAHCLCLDSCRVFTSWFHREERKGGRGRGEEGRKAAACDWGTERHTCKYKHAQAHALHHFFLLPLPPFLDGRTNLPSPKKEGMWEWVGVSATTEPFISLPLFHSHLVSTIHLTTGNKRAVLSLILHSPGTSASSLPIPTSPTARAAAIVLVLVILQSGGGGGGSKRRSGRGSLVGEWWIGEGRGKGKGGGGTRVTSQVRLRQERSSGGTFDKGKVWSHQLHAILRNPRQLFSLFPCRFSSSLPFPLTPLPSMSTNAPAAPPAAPSRPQCRPCPPWLVVKMWCTWCVVMCVSGIGWSMSTGERKLGGGMMMERPLI